MFAPQRIGKLPASLCIQHKPVKEAVSWSPIPILPFFQCDVTPTVKLGTGHTE